MNRFILSVLLGIAVMLVGAIVAEETGLQSETVTWPSAPRAQQQTRPGQVAPRTDHVREWVTSILDRPLFSPARRPPPGQGGAAGMPRLAGVLVSPSERRAIFALPGSETSIEAKEGSRIGAYVVLSINVGQVTLAGPRGNRVLRPSFNPASGNAHAAVAAPATGKNAGPSRLVDLLPDGPSGLPRSQ